MPHFIYVVKPPRDNFPETITDEEAKIVSEHFYYLKNLLEQKVVIFAGRTSGGDFGICVFECESMEKADAITANDPAIMNGIFSAETFPFELALYRNPED